MHDKPISLDQLIRESHGMLKQLVDNQQTKPDIETCEHEFIAIPVDGSNNANVSCKGMCRKCGYVPYTVDTLEPVSFFGYQPISITNSIRKNIEERIDSLRKKLSKYAIENQELRKLVTNQAEQLRNLQSAEINRIAQEQGYIFMGYDLTDGASDTTRGTIQDDGRVFLTVAEKDVISERNRQVMVEGYTPDIDDKYVNNDLAMAAASYASHDPHRTTLQGDTPMLWPWRIEYWRPSDRRSNLVKAGALIIAEIERIDRLQSHVVPVKDPYGHQCAWEGWQAGRAALQSQDREDADSEYIRHAVLSVPAKYFSDDCRSRESNRVIAASAAVEAAIEHDRQRRGEPFMYAWFVPPQYAGMADGLRAWTRSKDEADALESNIGTPPTKLYTAPQPADPVRVPSDEELIAWATEEEFFLFCDEDEFLQIARALLARYGSKS